MKIASIELSTETEGLKEFKLFLNDLVILTGSNGAGKTRLLKLIHKHVEILQHGLKEDDVKEKEIKENLAVYLPKGKDVEQLTETNAQKIRIINYSHYDAQLQLPADFSPYVIHKAKDILKECNYSETALNSLLFIEDMARGCSEEFQNGKYFERFRKETEENFDIKIDYNKESKKLQWFGQDIDKTELSPGQKYLLRMAVACFQNESKDDLIFFLDEPELHLHPKALIELLEKLRKKFSDSQFWISTHSLALISYFSATEKDASILYLKEGSVKGFKSDSSELLDGLIGSEENRYAMQHLMMTPDVYASNKFALECFDPPDTLPGDTGADPQVEMFRTLLSSGDIVVDYGAGKGRLFEELALGNGKTLDGKKAVNVISYYAYTKKEVEIKEDAEKCQSVMEMYGSKKENYYNNFKKLLKNVKNKANYVCLINVLHEISPYEWKEVFENVKSLLSKNGKLVIIEREELMIGEFPYDQGFLMITSNAAKELFGEKHVNEFHNPQKHYLVRYTIDPEGLEIKSIDSALKIIRQDALDKIQQIKKKSVGDSRHSRFQQGIKLAFWTHQYANASLLLNEDDRS